MNTYEVVLTGGDKVIVSADGFDVDDDGVTFFVEDETVAMFRAFIYVVKGASTNV